MRLPRLAIENHQFTIVVFAALIILGVNSFLTMPRTEDPPLKFPGASVFVIYPGANPVDMEKLVADPIEEALNKLTDIRRIETTIREGMCVTSIEFTFGTDENVKYDEVIRQVNSIRNELPEELYSLETFHWSSTDVVIMQLALVSEELTYRGLEQTGEKLKKQLEKLEGVMLVELLAVPATEVRISLEAETMARMNISLQQAAMAIRSNNANIPGGSLKLGDRSFNIRTSGSYENLGQLRRTVVSSFMGRNILLENIAEVDFAYEDQNYMARFNGGKAIFITVKQKEGYNIMEICKSLRKATESFREGLDAGVSLEMVFDQSESVKTRVDNFLSNLLSGIVLVGVVVFLSLGWRAAFLVIMAIPFSILIGLGLVDISGFGLHQITIGGLIISLGLLVDNSIVITENIERFNALGFRREEAAVKASSQIAWPVITATLTTMFAFIPIIMMPDKAGKFIQGLPVTVIATLFASLLIALTLTPYLGKLFIRPSRGGQDPRGFRRLIKKAVEGPYRRTLRFCLRKGWLVIFSAFSALLFSLWLFYAHVGRSFFPKAEKPQFMIRINNPGGTAISKTNQTAMMVESILDTLSVVRRYATNIGHGNPRIYYNTFPRQFDKAYAEIYVELYKYEVEAFDSLVAWLRGVLRQIPGARVEIKEFSQGAPIEAPLTLKITGEDHERLRFLASRAESLLRNIPGAINVENHSSRKNIDLFVSINRDKAGMYGVPVQEIDLGIRAGVAGATVSKFRDREGKEYPIVIRLPGGDETALAELDKIHVHSVTGRQVPLGQLASVELREAPGLISHTGMERCATITADIASGHSLDEVIAIFGRGLSDLSWPEGYTYKFTGELESREESFAGITRASLLAILAILAVLVLQFRSFSRSLIIFTALPLAVIGSVVALYVTGYSFSFTAGIGFISLIGIVVNNSIIMVDYTAKLTEEGKTLQESIVEAAETRFRPIVLTTLTTIGGLLPLTLRGGTLWAPMGWTIIGGLLVSTFLTLIVVPVLYKMFSRNPGNARLV